MSRVVITGGAGFIESNLAEALIIRGHTVRVLDNFSTGKKENLMFDEGYPALETIDGDIRNLQMCEKAMREIESVFHQASFLGSTIGRESPDFEFRKRRGDVEYSRCSQGRRSEAIDLCFVLFSRWGHSDLAEGAGREK